MLTCNVSVTDGLPPLVTGRSEKLHCFQMRKLQAKYGPKRKGWVMQAVFTNCVRILDARMISKTERSSFLWTIVLITPDVCEEWKCVSTRLQQHAPAI
jgi:hypothetical protein